MKKLTIILAALLLYCVVDAQTDYPIRFQHITSDNGLSQGHILCMLQDKEGYIWIGTYYGLNRFNGYSIDVFTENSKDTKALISKVVYSLFEDKDGYIWVGTVGGLDRFNKKTEIFEHIPSDTSFNNDTENSRKGLSDWYIHVIKQDKNGNIWVGTDKGGLNRIDYKTRKVSYSRIGFGSPDKLCSNTINDLLVDRKNRLWIATEGGGLSCMDLSNYSMKTYRHVPDNENSISSDKISCLYEDRTGKIWLGNFDGVLMSFDDSKNKFETHDYLPNAFKPRSVRIRDIDQDSEGNLLIATMGTGLIVYNLKTGSSQVNIHHLKDPGTIISNEAYSLLVDRTGTVFVGTYGMGISRYSPTNRKFPIYFVPASDIEGDKNSYTDCIEDSYGRLIIGTYSGFLVYDRKANTYKQYYPGRTYEDNKILTIAMDPDGGIWLGSNHSLHRYDKNLNKIKSYVLLKDNVDHPIYSIYFDHLHNLWFGLFVAEGLFKVPESVWKNTSSNTLKYKLYRTNNIDSTSITGDEIWCLKQDKDLKFWIADNLGVCYYNYEKDNFTRIKITNMPKTLEFDHDDNLWVTTRGDGVFFYNVKTKEIKHYTTKQGLCENFVFGAIVDKEGDVWFNTENRLSRFYPETGKFRNYDIYDGLPSNRFDDRSEKMLSDGEIYMGTAQGFTIFDPEKIKDETCKPNVVLTDFKISNRSVLTIHQNSARKILDAPIGLVSRIELSPDQRDFSLEFAALDYAAPHKIKYAYKLAGFDKEWINTDAKNRVARYTNLDGGEYTFMVKGTNSDGVWNDTPLKIKILVHPPFYKAVWFRLMMVLVIIILVILAFSWRIISEIKQKQKLSKLVAERTFEISEKNELLKETARDMSETNALLEERQQYIEEQKEELAAHRDELAKLNAQKDKLFSIIAHDLKNPFNVIMGYTDLLLVNNKNYDAEKRQKFLTYLQQSSHNAYLLLENLLQWSRAQSGTLIFDPVPIKIDKLIVFSIKQTGDLAENKGIDIIFEQLFKEVMVHADENMISTVLRNLLTNAIKFSHSGGTITVHLTKNETHAQISVSDTGVGMSKEVREDLFKLNKNISSDGTAGEKGTGLGMILCKEFIDAHKGQIWVESEVNRGTTFIFTLPLEN
jgi:signal transduction histidine kinase/ligand-binding sensor domain-containing protein